MVRETSPVVLVVEDDSAVRQPLVKFLQMRQYTVVVAETADEGLSAIKTHRPVAAIVDLRLRRGSMRSPKSSWGSAVSTGSSRCNLRN